MFCVPGVDTPHPLSVALASDWMPSWCLVRDQLTLEHVSGCLFKFDGEMLTDADGAWQWQVIADAMTHAVAEGLQGLCVLRVERGPYGIAATPEQV